MDGDFFVSGVNENCFDPSNMEVKIWSPPEWYQRVKSADYYGKGESVDSEWFLSEEWKEALIRFSRRYGQRWALTEEDILSFKPLVDALSRNFFPQYEIIFGYAYAAIPALLSSTLPYVAVEIGTMRDLPFEDSAEGRLLALAYRAASHVIITNPDVIRSAKELGVKDYTFVPHPLDEEVYKPLTTKERLNLHREYEAEYLLLAPARQNWDIKGNDKYLTAFAEIVKTGISARLLIPAWGQDVEQSKDLVKRLGIESKVVWLDPMPEGRLVKFYNSVDLVLDQFGNCRTFGLITPKAMACGVPVVLSYDPNIHKWCFQEQPPVIQAEDEGEIFQAMHYYLTNDDERNLLSHRCRDWVLNHHSRDIVIGKIDSVLEAVLGEGKAESTIFDSLRQKKLELRYESEFAATYDERYHSAIVYQEMDDRLVSILLEHLRKEGIEAPDVLDLGCGPGSMTGKLLRIPGIRLTGVDLSPAMIAIARARFPYVNYLVDDAEFMSFEDETFDVVFCSGVLHHLASMEMALRQIHRILKPGGIFVLREPNQDNFATRYPEVAFAHLCLKHYLYNALRKKYQKEPDAPEYHTDFDFLQLGTLVGEHFHVIDFYSDLKVSYFYDMSSEPDVFDYIRRLEQSLEQNPGLNVVFVARKDVESAIDPFVKIKLQEFKTGKMIDVNHFTELMEFADTLFREYSGEFYHEFIATELYGSSPAMVHMMFSNDILVWSDDRSECLAKGNALDAILQRAFFEEEMRYSLAARLLRKLRRKLRFGKWRIANLSLASNELLESRPAMNYDYGFFFLTKTVSGKNFIKLLDSVSDYGLIYVELKKDANIINIEEEELEYCKQFVILRNLQLSSESKLALYIGKYIYSVRDFFRAYSVALEKEGKKYVGQELVIIQEMQRRAHQKLSELEKEFSVLDTETLDTILNHLS
jgi:ubiquinone/menaquinone biosynthesis C-methylase UbiE/glycosyltransferase involved in cell wall biosynthesis